MIWLFVALPLVGAIAGVCLCLAAQRGRQKLSRCRYERLRIERQTRWAERRLHDIAQHAFTTMTEEARRARSESSRSA